MNNNLGSKGAGGDRSHTLSTLATGGSSTSASLATATTPTTSSRRQQQQQQQQRIMRTFFSISKVCTSRIIFLFGLLIVAILLGLSSYRLLSNAEMTLGETQFESIAERALHNSQRITIRKRLGTKTLASMIGQTFPNVNSWPTIPVNGFEIMAQNLIDSTSGRSMGLLPIITPNQVVKFENFVYNEHFPQQGYPNTTTGISSFGKGIFGLDFTLSNEDKRYHDINGTTTWGSPYQVMTPFLCHSDGPSILMANLHSNPIFGRVIDDMITCSMERAAAAAVAAAADQQQQQTAEIDKMEEDDSQLLLLRDCGVLTDILTLTGKTADVKSGPGAIIMEPIYPGNNPTELTGIISSTIVWEETLLNVFAAEVSGIDCIVETENQVYTYEIRNGIPTLKNEEQGDYHDPKFAKYAQSVMLNNPIEEEEEEATSSSSSSSFSATYRLTVYPNDTFFEVYNTGNSTIALIGSICIMILTSGFFMLYDFFVRQEFQQKNAILEAKRQFVRFISHEVRTPLNVVSMGLQLWQDEMTTVLNQQRRVSTPTTNKKEKISEKEEETTRSSSEVTITNTTNTVGSVGHDECAPTTLRDKFEYWLDMSSDILTNAHSAVDVLNDLLNYDKVESGTLHLDLSIIPCWELIHNTLSEFQMQAQAKNVTYIIDHRDLRTTKNNNKATTTRKNGSTTAGDIKDTVDFFESANKGSGSCGEIFQWSQVLDQKKLRAIGDTARISQVLRNLVSNALKFTPEGGSVTVRTALEEVEGNDGGGDGANKSTFTLNNGETRVFVHGGKFVVSVTDTGAGMSWEQLDMVFQDGTQFNRNALQAGQGSGLGLFIAKGIMERHGGSLTVESGGLGLGTTFTVTLPLYRVTGEDCHKQQRQTPAMSHYASTEHSSYDGQSQQMYPLRILIVDDSVMNRKLLVRLLQNQGHVCDQAEDGLVAVNRVKETMIENSNTTHPQHGGGGGLVSFYDTILMDNSMPNMSGPDAAQQIRAMGCDSLIVGITGNIFEDDVVHFKKCGANKVLPKPICMRDLSNIWYDHGVGCKPRPPPQLISKEEEKPVLPNV